MPWAQGYKTWVDGSSWATGTWNESRQEALWQPYEKPAPVGSGSWKPGRSAYTASEAVPPPWRAAEPEDKLLQVAGVQEERTQLRCRAAEPQTATAAGKQWQGNKDTRSRQKLCDESKARLMLSVAKEGCRLSEQVREAVRSQLQRKPLQLQDWLISEGLPMDALDELRTVLENDHWDGEFVSGKQWITEWLREGAKWAQEAWQEPPPAEGAAGLWCQSCWRGFSSEWNFQRHLENKDHAKKLKHWLWRYGNRPGEGIFVGRQAVPVSAVQAEAPGEVRALPVTKSQRGGAKLLPGDILSQAQVEAQSAAAIAKKELLLYRNELSETERQEVLEKIGLMRANDVACLESLKPAFSEKVYELMRQVPDKDWLWKEPTFSWLAGFYWHPDSTAVPMTGPQHSEWHCHLCDYTGEDEASLRKHEETRRHAESFQRWVHKNGALPLPENCARCPGRGSFSEKADDGGPYLDLSCSCSREPSTPAPEPEVPRGFQQLHRRPEGQRPGALPYVAFVVRPRRAGEKQLPEALLVASKTLRLGARVGPKTKDKHQQKWGVELQRPLSSEGAGGPWRSLAIPLTGSAAPAPGSKLDFLFLARWQPADAKEDPEQLGWLSITVPQPGSVLEVELDVEWRSSSSWSGEYPCARQSRSLALKDFVGSGQVNAFGGVAALRGNQRAFQLCTDEEMLSFLLHVPLREATNQLLQKSGDQSAQPAVHPVLVFMHGDMERGSSSWAMPGLAGFCDEFGPAEICRAQNRPEHSVRSFVVVTPSCPEDYWWFRHKPVHDSTSYVPGMERWFEELFRWLQDLHLTDFAAANSGIRLVGQSMGAYGALELARAMPERFAAVAALAPCFDASRLDVLAERLRDLPLWVIMARWDTMCAFEEAASLVLKLQDRQARCARLSSWGFKDHNDSCKPLKSSWLYRWLLAPA